MPIAPEYFTWDGDPPNNVPPRRPSTDDLGGVAKLDDQEFPPDDVTMPTAAGDNQRGHQVVGLGKVAPACKLSVIFAAGAPAISKVTAVGNAIVPGTFTVIDNGNGDTSITWPPNTFPPGAVKPSELTINEDIAALSPVVTEIANGIRVKTRNSAGALTDMAFTVAIN